MTGATVTRLGRAGVVALATLALISALAGCGGGGRDTWSEDDCVEHVRQVVLDASSLDQEAQAQRLQDLQKELVDHQCPQGLDGEPPATG